MKSLRRSLIAAVAVLGLSVGIAGTALATPQPHRKPRPARLNWGHHMPGVPDHARELDLGWRFSL
jgi:hypothetical protein